MNRKKEIREHFLNKRFDLAKPEFDLLNQNLCASFFSSVELFDILTFHTFLPLKKKREPNTWQIIARLKKDFSQIRIAIPKMNADNELVHFYFESRDQIKENKWGIPEPQFGEPTPIDKIDLVIVPLLAFDNEGNRVGYGKGFYDRFLTQCRPDCKKIGLSLFDPVNEISDANHRDVKLTHCVTPDRFYSF